MKINLPALIVATACLLATAPALAQFSTADELSLIRRELEMMRREQEHEAMLRAKRSDTTADDLRRLRQIEEQKLALARRTQEAEERAERERRVEEYYANVQRSATAMEDQVSRGQPLSEEQLNWVRSTGADFKARVENRDTQMVLEMIRETEQGFTGVGGRLPMSKTAANAAKQRILRDQTIFNRLAVINRANSQLTGGQQPNPSTPREEYRPAPLAPIPQSIRPQQPATNEVEARRRALMQQRR